MPFSNYTELQASVVDWIHRKGLAGVAPDFITLAEKRIKAELWAKQQDTVAELPVAAGVTAVPLPADFLSVRALSIPGVVASIEYVVPAEYSRLSAATGAPLVYTLSAGQMLLAPVPDVAYTLSLAYRAEFPVLSDAAPTNALLARWPDLYLWGALVEACIYSHNPEFQAVCEARFREAVIAINNIEWNAPGPLRVRTDARVC